MSSRAGGTCIKAGLALVTVVASACATSRAVGSPLDVREPDVTHLVVENQSLSEVQVYVVHGGARVSLGRVPATRSVRLVLPATLLKTGFLALQGEARPRVENGRFFTDPLNVLPGQTVRWRLEATGGRSFVSVSGRG